MNALPKYRLVKALLPVLLTVLVGFQTGLALHEAHHALEHTDHDTGCFICGVAGQFVAVAPEAPALGMTGVTRQLPRAHTAPVPARGHRPGLIRGPPVLFA